MFVCVFNELQKGLSMMANTLMCVAMSDSGFSLHFGR